MTQSQTRTAADRMELEAGQFVKEIGEAGDDEVRDAVEDAIEESLAPADREATADAVLLWFEEGDDDLADTLVDATAELNETGVIWVLTPKVGRPGYVEFADISEAASVAGLASTSGNPIAPDWTATRLVVPKTDRRNSTFD
ncbi:DUF3052 domain-containing protein [Umezawaea endophytica]|uniref:DUF3052 domain-containing protein n=1 Tax=Umezawaea endophytica TaxID=1654476 RepID=A0A9X2VRE5_9PSEU|nr:DUF3052 domain-containing protein [Umezawaea endophytica]MCS7480128.1 DUF3052 domain-containing protein [Umezawaea endophytica]